MRKMIDLKKFFLANSSMVSRQAEEDGYRQTEHQTQWVVQRTFTI